MVELGFPRRSSMQKWTPVEQAIWDAKQAVEAAGCHPALTDAVTLLGAAQEKVADYVDSITHANIPSPSTDPEVLAIQLHNRREWLRKRAGECARIVMERGEPFPGGLSDQEAWCDWQRLSSEERQAIADARPADRG